MRPAVHVSSRLCNGHALTRHADVRMRQRGLYPDVVLDVLAFGREVRVRGAIIYAVGRNEVEWFRREGFDLSKAEGVQVVCTETGTVQTVYRNPDFRGLRPRPQRARRGAW